MDARDETLEILKSKFSTAEAYKILDYFESRLRVNVAAQKDIYELKLAIEKVRADLTVEIEKNRTEIEKVRADPTVEVEKNRTEIEKVRASLLKWNFGFWMTQMVALVTILFKLLS